MEFIVYSMPDGSINVVSPVRPIEEVIAKDLPPEASNVLIKTLVDLPPDRAFRSAWRISANQVVVDMPRARDLHMDKIRKARDEKFSALDAEWMKFTGQNNKQEAERVEAKRQGLRALPQTTDLSKATTPEELKAIWPDELK